LTTKITNAGPEIITFGPPDEPNRRNKFAQLMKSAPIPERELMLNVGLFLTPQTLSRVLFMDFLYRQILDVQGVIMEFGCRWGQNLSLFTALRGIYEPYNRLRKVIGFDTFEGFPAVAPEDGGGLEPGDYATTPGYDQFLRQIIDLQEQESPLSHICKHEIIKGNALKTVPEYLERNQQTIISLAYFDFDLFEPTKECLRAIEPYLTKGSVIGFDEVNDSTTPGETVALREVFGLRRYAVKRFPFNARTSYLVIE